MDDVSDDSSNPSENSLDDEDSYGATYFSYSTNYSYDSTNSSYDLSEDDS